MNSNLADCNEMKKRTIIAISVVILAGLIGAWSLYRVIYPHHVINVDGKTLNLGQVYSQHLLTTVVITADGETILTVTAPINTVVKQLTTKLKSEVDEVNHSLPVGAKMRLATAYFNADITLHFSTIATYSGQHYAAISMPLEAVTVTYTANDQLQFDDIIELAQRYQNKTQQTFNDHYNFIK
ncbi:hypothetical protein C0W96_00705 [Photobacterium kishitanii]|uniref:hypothetical protein n=2 Tax=Photobacterium kishitanii TaxID=318456 RepID=UPI0005D41311|nr:hypothetical protein [Photobacterium kishitanii]KJG09466.1 hypothetical protein UB40_12110 [Photobacterium kishitanii]PSU19206.1 hypothetical protein CTM84_17250 [Photobacterium kishitanii]PSV07808.1 hypothetical protein C0W96_00705 [Photobacterium kishitanii]PSV15786.1 hypothetical protein C0W59_09305 [Photobacterium kishitanii]PSV76296.1 hypothetical protein C0W29_07945 [Photobacterium kishitanii]